ncbi:MAG TPA: ATP-binding protein [Polyangia bacterium]
MTNVAPPSTRAPLRRPIETIVLEVQRRLLTMMADGAPLSEVLETLCLALEKESEGAMCSVLLLDRDGSMRHAAAPSLPAAYIRAINGQPMGPHAASCGTAAFTRKEVVVATIADDPLWADYRDLALGFGLQACASVPIVGGADNRVLGAFAIYYKTPGPFPEPHLELLRNLKDLAATALLNHEREELLRESELRLERTEAFSLVMVAVTDLEGTLMKVPPTLCTLLGREEERLVGSSIHDLVHPDDMRMWRQNLLGILKGEVRSFDIELRLLRGDGQIMWTYVNTTVVPDQHGGPLHLMHYMRDLTLARKTEEGLRQMQRVDSLGVLAGGVAHDFNNLLTVMGANVELMRLRLEDESELLSFLGDLETSVRRAADLTRRLLAYAGRAKPVMTSVDLNATARDMVRLVGVTLPEQVEVRMELSDTIPSIRADSAQTQQVVLNLLTNAADAMDDRPGRIRIRTFATTLTEDDLKRRFPGQALLPGPYVALAVEDSGSGIDASNLTRIFEPFFTTKPTGHGLGLSALLGILRAHRGGFEIDSEVGRGTWFCLYFPADDGKKAAVRPERRTPATGIRHKLLLVDDQSAVREVTRNLLVELGYEVVTATDGLDAIAKLEALSGRVSAIVMDVMMSPCGAREAVPQIHERWRDLPVLLTSGYANEEGLRSLIGAGVVGFLPKPFSAGALEEALANTLRHRKHDLGASTPPPS